MYVNFINTLIKMLTINLIIFYSYFKSMGIKQIKNIKIILVIFVSILLSFMYILIKRYTNQIYTIIILYFIQLFLLNSTIRNKEISYYSSSVSLLISTAIAYITLLISCVIGSISKIILKISNDIINMIIITIIEYILIILFFKIKRFKNGFNFLKKQNEFTDLIIINIASIILFIYTIPGIIMTDDIENIGKKFFTSFLIFCIIMFIIIQKTLILYYKQKQLEKTLIDYEDEIKQKDRIIEEKTKENFKFSKINHEFYSRQKSLEKAVRKIIENNSNTEIAEELLIDISSLSNEYSIKQKSAKKLTKLPKTEIFEIDNMFEFMQEEMNNENIEFNLQINGNIHHMVNNIIPKNLLVTLIGDHLKDAKIAVTSNKHNFKNVLAVLGIKDKCYELCIYDSGIEFKIDTLLNLGIKPITTHKESGGTGIGFITTFETLNKTKASLIIEEKHPMTDKDYTKAVKIRFDNKNEYKIISYRAEEIKKQTKDNRIIIENL